MVHLASEAVTGSGRVTHGRQDLGRVGYVVEVTPDIPGRPHITGTLRGDPAMLLSLYRGCRVATLHLADGRCWDFVVSTPRGDVVNAANGRALFRPQVDSGMKRRPGFYWVYSLELEKWTVAKLESVDEGSERWTLSGKTVAVHDFREIGAGIEWLDDLEPARELR
jgi:hypothetical protein